jgi:hypothetical protein
MERLGQGSFGSIESKDNVCDVRSSPNCYRELQCHDWSKSAMSRHRPIVICRRCEGLINLEAVYADHDRAHRKCHAEEINSTISFVVTMALA